MELFWRTLFVASAYALSVKQIVSWTIKFIYKHKSLVLIKFYLLFYTHKVNYKIENAMEIQYS